MFVNYVGRKFPVLMDQVIYNDVTEDTDSN